MVDAIKTDHLDIFRHPQPQGFQPVLDFIAEPVGVAEDAVIIKHPVMGVGGEKGFKRRKAGLIVEVKGIKFYPPLPADCLKPHPAFVGFAGYIGALPEEQQLFAAQFQQLLRGQLPPAEVVGGHTGDFSPEMPVDADKGELRVHFQIGVVGQGDDAIHLVLPHQIDALLFGGVVVIGDGDDGAVTPLHQGADDGVGQTGKKGMAQVGPDQGHRVGLVGLETTGVVVDLIAQLAGGLINLLLGTSVDFLTESSAFRTIYIASGIWQDAGWGCIIYLATLSNVDTTLYEAAKVDGASVFQRILHIDVPALMPMVILNLIMSAGNLMNIGFEKVWLLQTDLNKATSDVIAVYVYQQGIENANYSYSTAVGLFNTAINLILLIVVNKIASKASDVDFV